MLDYFLVTSALPLHCVGLRHHVMTSILPPVMLGTHPTEQARHGSSSLPPWRKRKQAGTVVRRPPRTKTGRSEDERRAATLLVLLSVSEDVNGGEGDEPDLAQARLFFEDLTVTSGDPALYAAGLVKRVSHGCLSASRSPLRSVCACCCPSRARFGGVHGDAPFGVPSGSTV